MDAASETAIRLSVFAGLFAIMAAWEIAAPRRPLAIGRAWRWPNNLGIVAIDAVAVRLTQDQLIRQVIQGGGNMPAYGKNLSPAETTNAPRPIRLIIWPNSNGAAASVTRAGATMMPVRRP